MEKIIVESMAEVISHVLTNGATKATKYISKKQVIRAVLRKGKNKLSGNNGENIDVQIILKIGKPNYLEREFIKKCVEAGEPFPVKKSQLKFPNKKLNKLSRV